MSAPTIKDPKTRAIIGYNPPQVGQLFRFKPDTVVEFTDIMPCAITGKPFAWIFENPSGVELLYYPEEILEFLHDKYLIPI